MSKTGRFAPGPRTRPPPGPPAPDTPDGHQAQAAALAAKRLARRRRRMALGAVLFPLFFLLVIGIGLAAMHFKRMDFFKPAPTGGVTVDPRHAFAARLPARRQQQERATPCTRLQRGLAQSRAARPASAQA